jgi:hypothetical protein
MPQSRTIVIALLLLTTGASLSSAADGAKGTFHFGKVQFQPVDAIAFQEAGTDPAKPLTIVMLANFKIDRPAVMEAINAPGPLFNGAAKAEDGAFLIVRMVSLEHCGLSAFLNQGQQQIDLGNSFPAKAVTVTATRVAGECFTSTPGKMFDDAYDFRLSFDLPLTTIPKASALPAGGGEPGAAYGALVKAIQAADWNGAHLHLAESEVPATKPKSSEMNDYFHGLALNYPKTVKVTGGLMKGDRANLEIRGTNNEDKKIQGVVAMKKTSAGWRVLDQSFYFDE